MALYEYEIENMHLFPTEVQVFRWETPPGFNEKLSTTCSSIFRKVMTSDKKKYTDYNLWDSESPEIADLCDMFSIAAGVYLDDHFKPNVKTDHDFYMHAWLRIDDPKYVIPPHNHLGAGLVATYYAVVNINEVQDPSLVYANDGNKSGDLMLFDPRPAVRPRLFKSKVTTGISPEVGMMIVMPNYLLHWASPIYDGDEKVCIANNLMFVPKNRRGKLVNIA